MKRNQSSVFALCLLGSSILSACDDVSVGPELVAYPAKATDAAPAVWGTISGISISGGYGSGLAVDPKDGHVFYILTDRGPNTMTPTANQLLFPMPEYNPSIGKFILSGSTLTRVASIEMKTAAGVKITGLPNPAGVGATGETGITPTGQPITPDPEGLDPEGLALAPDGSFWVSDEYGPHLVHLDANGRTLERINPFGSGTGGRRIPLVYAKRRPNRGMEGLAITPDGKMLLGTMQNPLDNPTTGLGRASTANRILTFDIASGATHEYVYEVDALGFYVSDVVALTATTFLVDERDAAFPGDPAGASTEKKVYKIDLTGATDVTDPANGANGKSFNGKFLEALSPAERQAAGIVPVKKTLVSDLLTIPGGYPHDKFEGLAVSADGLTLIVTNDDDFGVIDNGQSGMKAKTLPMTGQQDRMIMYFVNLAASVR